MIKNNKVIAAMFLTIPGLILFLITFWRIPVLEQVEHIFLDDYISHMNVQKPKEKIIYITGNDQSIKEIGMWPWPRELHARLLNDYLSEAKTVGYDILFVDESYAGNDAGLAEAIAQHGNVILAYVEAEKGKQALHSLNRFILAAAGEGYVNGTPDSDGIVRSYSLMQENAVIAPSYVAAMLMASGYDIDWEYTPNQTVSLKISGNQEEISCTLEKDYTFFRFPVPADFYEVYNFADVLNGKVPKEVFNEAIVFVGMSAAGATDIVTVPQGMITGTQYNMDSMISLLSGVNPIRMNRLLESMWVLAVFVFCWFLCAHMKRSIGWIVPLFTAVICLIAARMLFLKSFIWVSAVPFIISIIAAYLSALLIQLIFTQRKLSSHAMSIDSLHMMGSNFSPEGGFATFEDYMKVLGKEIKASYEMEVINPTATVQDKDMEGFMASQEQEILTIAYYAGRPPIKHKIYLRLPDIKIENAQPQYAVLGMKKKQDEMTVKAVGTIIANAYVYFIASKEAEERSQLFYSMVQCMISAIDAKDTITSGHSQRVAEISEKIAYSLKLPEEKIKQIKLAAIIHDLGKIGIPDQILTKPGPFSDEDFKIMKEHPLKGAAIIEPISLEPEILDGILYHHERIDGKGYPHGKTGDELSITAKIVKIADVYDALISERQYKKAWPLDRVLNLFYEGRGTEFDEHITDVFIDSIKPADWKPETGRTNGVSVSEFVINQYTAIYQEFLSVLDKSSIKKNDFINNDISYDFCDFYKDFTCKNSFFDVSWYESTNSGLLYEKQPSVIYAGGDDSFFALKGTEDIKYIVYYFLRGYLTGGYIICSDSVMGNVKKGFKEPVGRTELFDMYDNGRMNILCGENMIVYLMKSIMER